MSSENEDRLTKDERLIDLLIQQATCGLSATERQELAELQDVDRWSSIASGLDDAEQFELTASAIDLAYGAGRLHEEMPREVQDKLLIAAGQFLASRPRLDDDTSRGSQMSLQPVRVQGTNWSLMNFAAVLVTAASLLLVAGWWLVTGQGNRPPLQSLALSTQQKFDQFMAAPPNDLVEVDWKPVQTVSAAGKVVWSDSNQQGFMLFKGLDVNDPKENQYQLWIFDTAKDQAHPVDGGVFDIADTGEVIVPIVAHIPVNRAVQFAVTIERPGGVTVSSRERIPLLASID